MLSGKSSSYAENTHVLQRITTKTTFGSLAAFPFPARQYLRTKFFKKLQQRLLLETGLCVSPRFQMCPEDACTRGCKVTFVAFV